MGYYSFYKIISDIIKKLFNVKIWKLCLIISVFIIFCCNFCKVFGYSSEDLTNVTINNTDYGLYFKYLTDNYNYFFINTQNYGSGSRLSAIIELWCSDTPMIVDLSPVSGMPYYRIKSTGAGKFARFDSRATGSSLSWSNSVNYFNNTNFDITLNGSKTLFNETYRYNSQYIGQDDNATEFGGGINNHFNIIYSNYDVKDVSGNIIFNKNDLKYPQIANSLTDLETLNFDVISVDSWDWSNKDIDVLFYDRNVKDSSTTEGLYPKRVITLNQNTSYFQAGLTADPNKNAIYWIPIDEIGLNLYVGGSYEIRLAERVPLDPPEYGADYYYNYLGDSVSFTISSDVSQDRINAINKEIEDTTNKKYHDETINKMDTINNNINNLNNNINNVNDALTNTTPDSSVSSDIDNSLNFDNQNEGLNNLNGGFFSRLTSILSNLLGYNLAEDTSVSIPFPNSSKSLTLHSKDIYDHVVGPIRVIINAFWVYVFSFYMWKFINKIYIAVSTGNILNSFSSSGEAITNDML